MHLDAEDSFIEKSKYLYSQITAIIKWSESGTPYFNSAASTAWAMPPIINGKLNWRHALMIARIKELEAESREDYQLSV